LSTRGLETHNTVLVLPDGSVVSADLNMFLSAERTGTGGAENVAHGLGVVPSKVLVFITGDARGAWAVFSIVEGAHTSTNVIVTVTLSMKYRILAFA